MIRTGCTALVFALAPVSPAAAEAWVPPAGCEVFLAVDKLGCEISNYYSCGSDPAGHRWQADFDPEGMTRLSLMDGNAVPLKINDLKGERLLVAEADSVAAPSVSHLQARPSMVEYGMRTLTGERVVQIGQWQLMPDPDAVDLRLVTIQIDGVLLQEVLFQRDEVDGSGQVQVSRRGTEYFHPEWRLIFGGPAQMSKADAIMNYADIDTSPVDFIFPGEPRFGSDEPDADCELLLTGL